MKSKTSYRKFTKAAISKFDRITYQNETVPFLHVTVPNHMTMGQIKNACNTILEGTISLCHVT